MFSEDESYADMIVAMLERDDFDYNLVEQKTDLIIESITDSSHSLDEIGFSITMLIALTDLIIDFDIEKKENTINLIDFITKSFVNISDACSSSTEDIYKITDIIIKYLQDIKLECYINDIEKIKDLLKLDESFTFVCIGH